MAVSAPFAVAQRGDPTIEHEGASIDGMVAEFMQENGVPGMAVAIVQAPYITRATGQGLADAGRRLLVGTNTLFDIGQMADAYTAVAAMQLVEAGKIDLDAPIGQTIAEAPKEWHAVTVRQLLHHQSGLPDAANGEGQDQDGSSPAVARLLAAARQPPAFEPGTRVARNNTDYLLLRLLVERASGEPYEKFVRANQFDRLGLKHTFFASELDAVPREKLAAGGRHRRFLHEPGLINPAEPAAGYRGHLPKEVPFSPQRPAIYASASDISLWDIGLAGDILIKDPKLRKILYEPASTKDGKAVPTSGPWFFPGHPGLMISTDSGAGFSSLLSRFTHPDELVCVTLLANKEGVDLTQLARRIAGAYDPKIGPPPGTASRRIQQSPFSVGETMDRLEAALREQGATIMGRIDHAQAAKAAGLKLGPTEEIIFGNPAAGTLLMQADRAVAVDLPLRAVAWEEKGEVWLAAADPVGIVRANRIEDKEALAFKMRAALDKALLKAVSE